ncbi:hypothetical protein D3C87_574440 [compost metagenome]
MVGPALTPVATDTVPVGVIAKPAGAPTRVSSTLAAAGGDTPLRLSLASTLAAEVVPGATPLSVSLPASSVPVAMLRVTLAVAHKAFGAGRQAW